MSNFNEKDHPRDADGKFTDGNKTVDAIRKYSSDPKSDLEHGNIPNIRPQDYKELSAKEMKSRLQKELPEHEQKIGKTKMTPEQKIASVHIDFDKDNILPELNSDTLERLGAKESKKVLLKKSVIDRNFEEHDDLTREDFAQIIGQALYDSPEVFSANSQKPNYYHLASIVETTSKGKPEIGLVLLDIDAQKENFEIVHAHYVRRRSYNRLKNKK